MTVVAAAQHTEISRARNQFKSDGFAVIKNVIPRDLIDFLHAKLLDCVRENRITNQKRDIHLFENGVISSAHNIADYMEDYRLLIDLPAINEIFGAIYGDRQETVFNSSYFAKPKEIGLETRTHQDNAFFCMKPAEIMTCWLPVNFSTKENGALYYFAGSQAEGDIEHVADGNLGASMCLSEKDNRAVLSKYHKTYIELVKGDCVIHSALVVHGSDENRSAYDRNAFNFSIASRRAIRDEALFNRYKSNLEKFLAKRKQ
jgi:ectoine hydroxylase-related dioxygenase (phytanoyl-CoA dioxygenase family)